MRLIHTGDWHLGRLLHGFHLTDDQADVLQQLVELARDERPDVVIVAGDVYDRAVPPPDAVALLDEVLSELTMGLGIPVVVIAGNHDSPERLAFGRRVLEGGRLHVRGWATGDCRPVALEDEHGSVYVCPMPFLEPARAREAFTDPSLHDHHSALEAYVRRIRGHVPAGSRSVAAAHAFVAGLEASESERPLSVGTSGFVAAEIFSLFDYAALGHLHRPQCAGVEQVRYAGSLMKYSVSEAAHRKSVSVVDMDAAGRVAVREAELSPRRDLRVLEGTLAELLDADERWGSREDYVYVRLRDRGHLLEPGPRLRDVFPNLIGMEQMSAPGVAGPTDPGSDIRVLDEVRLFEEFFSQVTGREPSREETWELEAVVETLRRAEREAS